MKRIEQAGGIVFNSSGQVLMVKAVSNMWTFPKGGLKDNEDRLTAANREIREETGISELTLIKKLGSYDRPGFTKENTQTPSVIKNITFYVFRTDQEVLSVHDSGTLEAGWVNLDEVAGLLSHEKDRDFFIDHKKAISSRPTCSAG